MPTKTVNDWALDVAAMAFAGIAKDTMLRNAISKSLAKAMNKDQFNFLLDRDDAQKKYLVYIKKANDLNLSDALLKKLKDAKDDKEFSKLMNGPVQVEVEKLFRTNLKNAIVTQKAFEVWVELQNKPSVTKLADKLAKDLGIKDKAELARAVTEEAKGATAAAKKIIADLESSEKKKDLYSKLEAAVRKG